MKNASDKEQETYFYDNTPLTLYSHSSVTADMHPPYFKHLYSIHVLKAYSVQYMSVHEQ